MLWFVDGDTVHMACSDPELEPRNQKDDQVYRIVDVSNPSKPVAVGRWHLPGTMEGDDAPPPARLPKKFDAGFRAHNTNVYPERPDRCYLGYLDGGMMVLDIADRARPKLISRWSNSPPYNGFTHTVLPLFGRDLLVVTDESVQDDGADWPKLVWLLDARDETQPGEHLHAAGHRREAAAARRRPLRRAQRAREPAGARRLALGGLSCSAPSSTPACGSTTSAIPTQPSEVALVRAADARRRRPGRHRADQRCLRRRPRHRLRGGSPRRRAVRAGDEASNDKRAPCRSTRRYDFVPLVERKDYSWPGGKRLAFVVTTNVEWFAFGAGLGHDPAKTGEPQTHRNYAWRDYGNRIGIWRLLDLFDELKLPAAHNTNTLRLRLRAAGHGGDPQARRRGGRRTAAPTPRTCAGCGSPTRSACCAR